MNDSTKSNLTAYNTDVGWLSIPTDKLITNVKRAVECDGFKGIKIKVGSKSLTKDIDRLEKVRNAAGTNTMVAVDANGKWELNEAKQFCNLAKDLDVHWLEEPLWYDNLLDHKTLSDYTNTPIALGEQLYTLEAFEAFITTGSVQFPQPDVTRLAGISDFLKVADKAHERRLPITAHVGDMGQIHVHLSFAHPACSLLEYIPWISEAFEEPIKVKDGEYFRPEMPGAGTTPKPEKLHQYGKSL